jgi:membrane protein DedA with SNARE-associated domain
MSSITDLFNHYGYIVLFIALTIELIAFPTPGETLMAYCGFLVFQGQLNWIISIAVASLGVITGITISYFIGRVLGKSFFEKHGSKFHLGPEKLEKASKWFEKYGNGILVVAYFIPGVRHITGYFSGITKIPYKRFALNAYIGAIIWTSTFITLGKILGSKWDRFHASIMKYLIIGGIIIGVILICIYLYKYYKNQIIEFVVKTLQNSYKVFHSLGKIKIAVLGVAVVFVGLSILVASLIQDFLANEFTEFDTVTVFIVNNSFGDSWLPIMRFFRYLTAYPILALTAILLLVWILKKGTSRLLELRYLIITILGGEFLEEILRVIFHRLGPLGATIANHTEYTFPSEQTLMAFVTFGFAAFILLRHAKSHWIRSIAVFIALGLCLCAGLSSMYFQLQYPSDVVAGYVFGGVWLSLNIVLLEVYRILPKLKNYNNDGSL